MRLVHPAAVARRSGRAAAVHARAVAMGAEVVWTLRDERFGQRHFMVRDPTGLVLDVISPIPVSLAFRREVARWRRTRA